MNTLQVAMRSGSNEAAGGAARRERGEWEGDRSAARRERDASNRSRWRVRVFTVGSAVGGEFCPRGVGIAELSGELREASVGFVRAGRAGGAVLASGDRVFASTGSLLAPALLLLLSLPSLSHADRRLGLAVLPARPEPLPDPRHLPPTHRRSPPARRSPPPLPPRPRFLELPVRRRALGIALGARQGRPQRRRGAAEVPRLGREPGRRDLAPERRDPPVHRAGPRGSHAAPPGGRAAGRAAERSRRGARAAAGGARARGGSAGGDAERGEGGGGGGGAAGREAGRAARGDGERRDGGDPRDVRGGRRGAEGVAASELHRQQRAVERGGVAEG